MMKVSTMLRFKVKELLAQREFKERRVIALTEVATATGMNRMTLSKIANNSGANTTSDNLDKLCTYFECKIEDLVEHLPE